MSKVPTQTDEDDILNKNIQEEDEDIIDDDSDEDESDDDTSSEDDEADEDGDDDEEGDEDEDEDDKKSNKKKSKTPNYRAQLNAQNRFLQKQGFEFVNGKWQKKATDSKKKPSTTSTKSEELSTRDVIVLVEAKITHDDDIAEVRDFAKLKNISIKEALNSKTLQQILSDNREERASADATHIGSTKRSTGKRSSQEILSNAGKGQLPDDPAELARARAQQRISKSGKK